MDCKRDELLNGVQVRATILEVTLPAGSYKRGMLLGKVSGVHNLIGETGYTVDTIDAVLTEDLVLTEQGSASGYFSGEFNEKLVIVKTGIDVNDVKDHARKLRIFIG